MREIWRPIKGFSEVYQISNFGNVRIASYIDAGGKLRKAKQVRIQKDEQGYCRVPINRKNFRVHRLVAIHFLNNDQNLPQVNHLDGCKSNNHYTNLEWVDQHENMRHAFKTGLNKRLFATDSNNYKGNIMVFNESVHVDTLYGKKDTVDKGYNYQCVNNCINDTQKTHKGMTFKRI